MKGKETLDIIKYEVFLWATIKRKMLVHKGNISQSAGRGIQVNSSDQLFVSTTIFLPSG